MKKFFINCALMAGFVACLASCASVRPVGVTSNPVGSKRGEATEVRFLGIPFTEAGIDRAAANGGITKISHVDQRTQFLWPLFGKSKTVVYGE